VFVYDIEGGTPVKRQVLTVPNAFEGLAWNPTGREFYVTGWILSVAGGFVSDDVFVFAFDPFALEWKQVAAIPLGHTNTLGLGPISPAPAGLAVSADGTRLVAANYENDSITIVNIPTRQKV
jgi:DNA-binding beta-propeller fold protein YncE